MEKSKQKAIRRHHIERLKENRKNYWFWGGRKDPRRLGLLVHTPAPCSCYMCGNPRKWWKQKSIDQISFEEFASKCEMIEI